MAHLDTGKVRISWLDFNEVYGAMALFFKAKTTEPIDQQYYKRVNFYPLAALKNAIEKYIDGNRPIPSNFPSPNDLATLCADWLKANPEIREPLIVYDPIEDLDFPVERLWQAFDILTNHGVQRFYKYCNAVRMPLSDRDRVIWKAKTVANKNGDKNLLRQLKNIVSDIGQDINESARTSAPVKPPPHRVTNQGRSDIRAAAR